jgi:ankyrin repeat protein
MISSFDKPIEPPEESASRVFLNLKYNFGKHDSPAIKLILNKVKDINETDPDNGFTILMYCIEFSRNKEEDVKVILNKKPDISIKNKSGQTALDIAKKHKIIGVIKLLEDYNLENVKPKDRNEKCDIIDTLTVPKLNEVFKEINQPVPAAKILKAERLQRLKDILGC